MVNEPITIDHPKLVPLFERIFGWGDTRSFNDVDMEHKAPVKESKGYCRHRQHTVSGTESAGR